MPQLNKPVEGPETKTVYCLKLEGPAVGGVKWFVAEGDRDEHPWCKKPHVWFDLDVPAHETNAEITELADQAESRQRYDDDRADCRLTGLFNGIMGVLL